MKAVNAYFDGETFVPEEQVFAVRNQRAVITILDEQKELSETEKEREEAEKERALQAVKNMRGMFKGTGLSSEAFMARKEYEKSLEL